MNSDQPQDSAIDFPCEFPIKAMGQAGEQLELAVMDIVRRHAPELREDAIKTRPSANGNYLSVTVTITAQSREQLDAIYMELTACEHVLMAL
jgi:putative lipoic acid-binding regulatory protein